MDNTIKKTQIYDIHKELNANIVNYNGTYLPIYYSSIQNEHNAVRNHIGLFDVSHMGNLIINTKTRNEAISFFNYLLPNNYSNIVPHKAIYSTMLNHNGCVIDDLIVMSVSETSYHIIVNAANIQKDYEWILKNNKNDNIEIKNMSDNFSIIAVQGPESEIFLKEEFNFDISDLKSFELKNIKLNNYEFIISKTGYTGENGYEIIINNENACELFKDLLNKGKAYNLLPCGLGARDILRLEAALPLYGHELDEEHSPLQTNIFWSVKLNKPDDFIGKDSLLKNKDNYKDKLLGFTVESKSIPRSKMIIINNSGNKVGYVTSGTYSPYLKKNIGLAYINNEVINNADELFVQIRNNNEKIKIVDIPFYKKK